MKSKKFKISQKTTINRFPKKQKNQIKMFKKKSIKSNFGPILVIKFIYLAYRLTNKVKKKITNII